MTLIKLLLASSCAAIFLASSVTAGTFGDKSSKSIVAGSSGIVMACNSCDAKKDRARRDAARKGTTRTRGHNGDWEYSRNNSRPTTTIDGKQVRRRPDGSCCEVKERINGRDRWMTINPRNEFRKKALRNLDRRMRDRDSGGSRRPSGGWPNYGPPGT